MAVVLVTGGSSGIGLAIVRRLAGAGHDVYAASRNPHRAELPEAVTPLVLDVADPEAAGPAVDEVVRRSGRLDVVVNNAGTGPLGPIEETGDDDARHVFEVNLFGPLRLARAAIPVMRAQGRGHIVNVTSMNDVLPAPFGGWYSASKAALASASCVLDAEVHGFGISVTVVAPGLFRTAMAEKLQHAAVDAASSYRTEMEALARRNAERLDAAADPDEVAAAVEECIAAEHPPARVVVGRDAKSFSDLVRRTEPDEMAALLREFVRDLGVR